MTSTSPARVGAGDELLGHRVDRARRRPARRPPRGRRGPCPPARHRSRCRGARSGVVPASAASASSHPTKSNSGWAVIAVVVSMAPRPVRAWFATAWAGQYPAASGCVAACQARKASSSPLSPGRVGSRACRARRDGRRRAGRARRPRPSASHRAERRDHRRHVDGGHVEARRPPAASAARTPSRQASSTSCSKLPGDRRAHLVRDAGPGDDVPVRVGGDRLHRGRADVDAHGHARRPTRS